MENKIVFFGKIKTVQVKCPKCQEWQFKDKESNKCSNCEYDFNEEKTEEKKPTEYRSEISTWRKKIKDKDRLTVYQRDDFICQYCGIYCFDSFVIDGKSLTIDHKTPFSGGGSNEVENLITCCRECNSLKTNKRFKTFEEAREYIFKRKKDNEGLFL